MRSLLLSSLLLLAAGAAGPQGQETVPQDGFVVVCPITGMVDDGMAVLVERAVQEAQGAAALVLEVDTPGGLVDSAIEISKIVMEAGCPAIAYVKGMGAISAGALISYSCKHIVMAPGTNIGASAPVIMGGQEPSPEYNEKTKSYLRSRYRALAEVNGYDPLLAEAMVDAQIEVWGKKEANGKYVFVRGKTAALSETAPAGPQSPAPRDAVGEAMEGLTKEIQRAAETLRDAVAPAPESAEAAASSAADEPPASSADMELICRAGELLTLTTSEAERYGLIPFAAPTLDAALAHFGHAELRRVPIIPTWSETLFRWLTSPLISGLLLMLGVGGIYVELRTPGFGLPGIVGMCCLGLFFGSHMVIGLANWIDLLLVAVGVALVLIEVFLVPGFGIIGVSGIVCILAGVYLSLTRVPIPQYSWEFDRLQNAGQTVTTASILFVLFVIASWKLFPKTPFYRWLVLAHTQDPAQGYSVQSAAEAQSSVGLRGVADSVLRPSGRGRFSGKTLDVVTRGEYLEPGTPIEIIQVDGNRHVVAACEEELKS